MKALDDAVVIVIPGDLHLTEPQLENVRVAQWVIDEVNQTILPDFVQFIGDNVQDATEAQFRLFDDLRGRLEVPHYALVGDHDVKGDPTAEGFRRHVGPTYGATSRSGCRFLRLNTQEAAAVGISTEQAAWFEAEVDLALGAGERVVVFQHNYPYQIWKSFAGPGIDRWRAVVQTRRIAAIVSGHTHYLQVANDGRNVCVATRSIGDPEGGPPGYTLLYFKGDDFALTYRAFDEPGPVVLITHPRERLLATGPEHVVHGRDRVVVRCWPCPRIASARFAVDGGAWAELEPLGDGHWTAPLDARGLAKGEHALEVAARSLAGVESRQRIGFMVDPTGRYTAVPEVRPVVTATAFC